VHPLNWLRRRDAGLAVTRRAARTAIVMPLMFALGGAVIGNATIATYAAFGSFALLLFVDFGGPVADRVRAQVGLALVGVFCVAVGTLVSPVTWLATLVTAVLAFAVIFSGVVSSVLAGAATSMLLPFILSSSLPGTIGSIPDRIAGWGLATAASLLAITVLWPTPSRDPLRGLVVEVCHTLAARLRAEVAAKLDLPGGAPEQIAAAVERADTAIAAMQRAFYASPYRPTGLSTGARAAVRLVDELSWLTEIVQQESEPSRPPGPHQGTHASCRLKFAAATVLDRGGDLLDEPAADPAPLRDAVADMVTARGTVEEEAMRTLPDTSSLDPSFRAQETSYAVGAVAANIELVVAADRRTLPQRLLGYQPTGHGGLSGVSGIGAGSVGSARERAAAHLEPHSVWLHNSIRAAIGLALAVLVARLTGVQHSFWVVLGTLAVLRSNALNTGQNVLRGLIGTLVGIVVGGVLVALIGSHLTASWIVLPFAILFAGLAPATISFAAGQTAFTIVLVVLFNIIEPTGWRVGLVRIEDVAIGSAVSLVVGLLFWPRGAGRALNKALAEAYEDSAQYLRAAVDFGVSRCDRGAPGAVAPQAQAQHAAASARRLDDAFRTYLGERGAKPVSLETVTRLVTGVAGLRLAADAVLEMWRRDHGSSDGDRTTARQQLQAAGHAVSGWYAALGIAITGVGRVPEPLPPDSATTTVLREAVERDLGGSTATAVRMVWTGGHLDAARRLQSTLVTPAAAVAAS
jgi:hypothetical protein